MALIGSQSVGWTDGSATPSTSITVPSGTTHVLFLATWWRNASTSALSSISLTDGTLESSSDYSETGTFAGFSRAASRLWAVSSTGSKTLAATFAAAPEDGPCAFVVYLDEAPTVIDAEGIGNSGSDISLSVTLTGLNAGDFVFSVDTRDNNTTPPGNQSGWTSLQTAAHVLESGRLRYIEATGSSVTSTSQPTVSWAHVIATAVRFSASGDASVSPDGAAATASAGSVSLSSTATTAPSGVSATASAGVASASGGAVVAPSGAPATASAGTATQSASGSTAATGASASALAGTVSASGDSVVDGTATPDGAAATASAGDVSPTAYSVINISGTVAEALAGAVEATAADDIVITALQANLIYQIALLHGLDPSSPLTVSATGRSAGTLIQTITGTGPVTVSTVSAPPISGSVGDWIDALAALHGLTADLVVDSTSRTAGSVVQAMSSDGATTTVETAP